MALTHYRPMENASQDRDARETTDDPRQQTDEPTHRQTNKPWTGNPEKDQLPGTGPISTWRNGRSPHPLRPE